MTSPNMSTTANAVLKKMESHLPSKRDAESNPSLSPKRLRVEETTTLITDHARVSPDADADTDADAADGEQVATCERNPMFCNRNKYALLFMYSGEGYYGLQRNWEFPSIENEIMDALLKLDLISQAEHSFPSKVFFQRASKTDKGVSALGNAISIRIKYYDELVKDLNAVLPQQIRLLDAVRATKKFDARWRADSRTYSYLMPTFTWASKSHACGEDYRISAEQLARVRHVLSFYVGTRNYCHFTSGRAPDDKSCIRYMNSFIADEPFLYDGLEFVKLTVHGQSFMLHQIRKMIGLAIGVVKGYCDESIFETVFIPCANRIDRLDLPRAPGLGLMLEHVNYKFYNDKFCKNFQLKPIDWTRYTDQVEAFRRDCILPHIVASEKNEGSMCQWLASLPRHNYLAERPALQLEPAASQEKKRQQTEALSNSDCDLLAASNAAAAPVVDVNEEIDATDHSSRCVIGEIVSTDEWPANVLSATAKPGAASS